MCVEIQLKLKTTWQHFLHLCYLLTQFVINYRVMWSQRWAPSLFLSRRYLFSPEGGAIDQSRKMLDSVFFLFFFLTLVSHCPAVSASQKHIYCALKALSSTCKKMKSMFLLCFIVWFADAELKPRKGKTRPCWCLFGPEQTCGASNKENHENVTKISFVGLSRIWADILRSASSIAWNRTLV